MSFDVDQTKVGKLYDGKRYIKDIDAAYMKGRTGRLGEIHSHK